MNDKLKRRLAGAALLLAVAFIIVSLLPTPEQARQQAGVEVVTIPLHDVVSAPPPVASTDVPQTLAAPADAPAADADGGPDSGSDNGPDSGAAAADADDLDSSGGDDDASGDEAPAETRKPVTLALEPSLKQQEAAKPQPQPQPAAPVEAKPETIASPKPAAPAPKPQIAAAKPGVAPPAATAGGGKAWFVQVGGFADIDNARRVQDKLQDLHQPNVLAPIETAKGTIYRVRAGPFASESAAQQALNKIVTLYAGSKLIAP